MSESPLMIDGLGKLLEASKRPVYAVDAERRVVYCNAAVVAWLDMERDRIVGRIVEYHSESEAGDSAALTELCPPPAAMAGENCTGTISCTGRGGGLLHRRAEFMPLETTHKPGAVLVMLAERDMTPAELAAQVSGEQAGDTLHRTLRQFRRDQEESYAIESLLGGSAAMRKLRAQVAAAAVSGANVLVSGCPGSGRGHVARAIHYRAAGDADVRLVPIDCELANADLMRRAFDTVHGFQGELRYRPTLLLENLDRLAEPLQSALLAAIDSSGFAARVVATCHRHTPWSFADGSVTGDSADGTRNMPLTLEPALLNAVSTITIDVPRLNERMDDLPMLAQCFMEAANQGCDKQVGTLRTDALNLLALYTWPGELAELREVITTAHRACTTHEIGPGDLPVVVHHAARAAAQVRRQPERIVLDDLLATIEREAIVRAMAQTKGNKSEASELLGLTRPRLYRRLVQLGLAGPEFIEAGDEETL